MYKVKIVMVGPTEVMRPFHTECKANQSFEIRSRHVLNHYDTFHISYVNLALSASSGQFIIRSVLSNNGTDVCTDNQSYQCLADQFCIKVNANDGNGH